MDRLISSDVVEQLMLHLRQQRSRALDTIWLIEKGATLYDGRDGAPMVDATARWLAEQKQVVADVDVLVLSYESANTPG